MKRSILSSPARRAIQISTLLLAFASVSFGAEPVSSGRDAPLIGSMVVTASRPLPLMGTLVVTAPRSRAVLVADLGEMTVTAPREIALARNDMPRTGHAPF